MISFSQDLFYVVLSLSVLWFTVFLCWVLYQAGRALKNINLIIENVTHKLELITDAVEFIRGKVDVAADQMGHVSKFFTGTIGALLMKSLTAKLEDAGALSSKATKKKKKKAASTKKK